MKEQDDEAEKQKDQRKNVLACWGRRRIGKGTGEVYIIGGV